MQARIGAERPYGSARRPHVRLFIFSFVISIPRLASRHYLLPPSRLDHRRKINGEQITFLPVLTASHLPSSVLFAFLFLLYFRQRRSTLSRSHTALVRSRTFLITFLPFLLTFSLLSSTFFLNVRHNDDAFTYPSPTPILLPPDTITNRRNSHVFKQASSSRTALEHPFPINLSVCLFLFFYPPACISVLSSSRRLRSWTRCPHRASFLITPHLLSSILSWAT